MTLTKMLAVLSLGLFASGSAFAQDSEDGRQIKYKERTEIDFEGVDVSGELVKPAGALLMDVKRNQFIPLITFRTDFDAEMRQSVDEVK